MSKNDIIIYGNPNADYSIAKRNGKEVKITHHELFQEIQLIVKTHKRSYLKKYGRPKNATERLCYGVINYNITGTEVKDCLIKIAKRKLKYIVKGTLKTYMD